MHVDPRHTKEQVQLGRDAGKEQNGKGAKGKVVGVKDSSSKFLQYLDTVNIHLGTEIEVQDVVEFDGTLNILLDKKRKATISKIAAQNIYIGK